jgi:hypothetical protein
MSIDVVCPVLCFDYRLSPGSSSSFAYISILPWHQVFTFEKVAQLMIQRAFGGSRRSEPIVADEPLPIPDVLLSKIELVTQKWRKSAKADGSCGTLGDT